MGKFKKVERKVEIIKMNGSVIRLSDSKFTLVSVYSNHYIYDNTIPLKDRPSWCNVNNQFDSSFTINIIKTITTKKFGIKKSKEEASSSTIILNRNCLEYKTWNYNVKFDYDYHNNNLVFKELELNIIGD